MVVPTSQPAGAVVVAVVTGGTNDVSRYGEIIERSLVHSELKHYFLVELRRRPRIALSRDEGLADAHRADHPWIAGLRLSDLTPWAGRRSSPGIVSAAPEPLTMITTSVP
jgi:hypothetical protein